MSEREESPTLSPLDHMLGETGTVSVDSVAIPIKITEAGHLGGSVG